MSKEWMDTLWVFLVFCSFYAGWIVACIFAGRKITRLQNKITQERQARREEETEIVIDLRGRDV